MGPTKKHPDKKQEKPDAPRLLEERKRLIDRCDRSLVPAEKWTTDSTHRAQLNIFALRGFLLAGCDYTMLRPPEEQNEGRIWIRVYFKGPTYHFKRGSHGQAKPLDEDIFYLPTEDALKVAGGKDWSAGDIPDRIETLKQKVRDDLLGE